VSALLVLLALSGTIRVQVEGEASEVVAFRRGVEIARLSVKDGVVEFGNLPPGEFELVALGVGRRSVVEPRVRPSTGTGFDARLTTHPAHMLRVETEPGAYVHVGGVRFPAERVLLLPGCHRIVVDHDARVSSSARLVRIDADQTMKVPLDIGLVVAGVVNSGGNALQRVLSGARIDVYADGYPTGRTATADAEGRFVVTGFRGHVISLRIKADGHATLLRRVQFEPGSERSRVVVSLRPGVSITLPVDGAGNADVRATLLPRWLDVALEEPRLRANDEAPVQVGRNKFTFVGLTSGRRYRILLESFGSQPAATQEFEAGAQDVLPSISLSRSRTLRGTLVTGESGVRVVCRSSLGERTCRTDRAGRFVFDGLPQGRVVLLARDRDERGVVIGDETEDVTLAIEAPPADRFIEGTVLDADRKPLAGVQVLAAGLESKTNGKGAFRLGPVPLGRARFVIRFSPLPGSRGFRTDPHLPRLEDKAQPGIQVRAQLERAGVLDLTFPEARFARATLLLKGTSGERLRWRVPRGTSRLRIDEIALGGYSIEIGAPGTLGIGGELVRAGDGAGESTSLHLLSGRRASGRVVRRRGISREGRAPHQVDTPVPAGEVVLLDAAERFALAVSPIAEDGSFVLEGLPESPILLCAAIPGHPIGVIRVDLTSANVDDIVIPIYAPMPARVQVRTTADRPVAHAIVGVMNEYGIDVRDIAARARFRGVVADDSEFGDLTLLFRLAPSSGGIFEHKGLAPGNYEFRVTAMGFKPGAAKVRVRAPWTLTHVGALLPELMNPVVPVWLERQPITKRPAADKKPGAD
jgi:hypothetical protein